MKNKFWTIFGIATLIFVLLLISVVGIMFMFPGTSILGFAYIQKNEAKQYTYTTETDASINGISAIEVNATGARVWICSSENTNKLVVRRRVNYNGFARTNKVNSSYSAKVVEERSFKGSDEVFRTFVIEAIEPNGIFDTKNTSIEVFLPKSINFSVVSAKSDGSTVNFSNKDGTQVVEVRDVHLSSTGSNKIFVRETSGVQNFYFSTVNGEVSFSSSEKICAKTVDFSTTSGSMNVKQGMEVEEKFKIESTQSPTVNVNSFDGELEISSNKGTFNFETIGANSTNSKAILNLNEASFYSPSTNAFVSLLDNCAAAKNDVVIGKLTNPTTSQSYFTIGAGRVFVNQLECDASFNATSGSIVAKNIKTNCSVNAYSDSGQIELYYLASSTAQENTFVKVFSKTGNIYLNKISGFLDVNVLESSPNSVCSISFASVCFDNSSLGKTNTINAKDRKVDLSYVGTGEVISRIFANTAIDLAESSVEFVSEVQQGDMDYVLNRPEYSNYSHEYRVFYDRPNNITEYTAKGLIFINSTSQIVISYVS